jgi:hypothetical protein
MGERYREALPALAGKAGFLVGGLLTVRLMSEVADITWWSARPLWFHMLPLVAMPLLGFAGGFALGKYAINSRASQGKT